MEKQIVRKGEVYDSDCIECVDNELFEKCVFFDCSFQGLAGNFFECIFHHKDQVIFNILNLNITYCAFFAFEDKFKAK